MKKFKILCGLCGFFGPFAVNFITRINIIIFFLILPVYFGYPVGVVRGEDASAPDFSRMEGEVLKNFYDGDSPGLFKSMEKLLLAHPLAPESFLYYSDFAGMADICGRERALETLKSIAASVEAAADLPGRNIRLLALDLEIEKILSGHDRIAAENLSKRTIPLDRWLLSGPYSKYGFSDLRYSFMPEITSPVEASIEKRIVSTENSAGHLDLGRYLYPAEGVAYALTTISPRRTVKIRIYSECQYRLFINGRRALENTRAGIFRECRVVRIWNAEDITVMMKVYSEAGREWGFRALVTDENDAPLDVNAVAEKFSLSDVDFIEEPDYPLEYFQEMKGRDQAEAYFRLALYFDGLGSPEAIDCYKKSIVLHDDPVKRYFLADCMIGQSGGVSASALYLEGWKIMKSLADGHPGFIPARHMRFRGLLQSKSFPDAFHESKKILSRGGRYLPMRLDFADLLGYLGYEKEHLAEIKGAMKLFPFSADLMSLLASYYSSRNAPEAVSRYQKCLDMEYRDDFIKQLIVLYNSAGEYGKIISLISGCPRPEMFLKELIEARINSGNFEEAKKIIFAEMIKSKDPYYNFKLGLISFLEEQDPSMYLEKALKIAPSVFSAGDFLRYVKSGAIEDPFAQYREESVSDRINPWIVADKPDVSSEILYRNMMFILNEDGGSRIFCEDVIYVNDENAVEEWGEYRVPFEGMIRPVRARVYDEEGGYNDSCRIHKTDGESYITLSSLKERSIIHVSYFIDNPAGEQPCSRFFSIPFTEIQNFDVGLDYFSLKVIALEGMKVNFYFNREVDVLQEASGGRTVYSASLKNLGRVNQEYFAGDSLNQLPFFTFSSMDSLDDFALYYNGLLDYSTSVDLSEVGQDLRAEDAAGTVKNVYNFISDEIDLSGDALFYPVAPADTLVNRRGSAEDRTILAMSILSALGIRSFPAFARSDCLPDTEGFISQYNFTDILLYVPLEAGSGLWLDFSGRFFQCGTVKEDLAGMDAVVIIKNSHEIKKIADCGTGKTVSIFELSLDDKGGAEFFSRIEFDGRDGIQRNSFLNKNYHEDMINRYFSGIIPSASIYDYKIENLENRESPFILSARGRSLSIAAAAPDRIIFQPVLRGSMVHRYIRYSRRESSLFIDRTIDEKDQYTYHLPSRYSLFALDKTSRLMHKFGCAEINIKKSGGSDILSVTREVRVMKTRIPPGEYGEFLDFCLKLKKLEHENIIVKL